MSFLDKFEFLPPILRENPMYLVGGLAAIVAFYIYSNSSKTDDKNKNTTDCTSSIASTFSFITVAIVVLHLTGILTLLVNGTPLKIPFLSRDVSTPYSFAPSAPSFGNYSSY